MPICPSHVDRIAKREWERVAPLLNELGLLTELDGTLFAGYCQLYARWVAIEREIRKSKFSAVKAGADEEEGEEVEERRESNLVMLKHTIDAAGNTFLEAKQSPLVTMARQTLKEIRMFCAEFGMTPSSRGRMVVGGEPKDPMDEFLGRKKK